MGNGVVYDRGPGNVLEGNPCPGHAGHVVHDHVVEDVQSVPGLVISRRQPDILGVHGKGPDAPAVSRTGQVTLNQVGVNGHRARSCSAGHVAADIDTGTITGQRQ